MAYAAAFIFHTIPQLTDLDAFSWWTISDVFEEGWLRGAPFYGGYGLLTSQGVAKPAYRAFELLNGAGDQRIPVAVTGQVTRRRGLLPVPASSPARKPASPPASPAKPRCANTAALLI